MLTSFSDGAQGLFLPLGAMNISILYNLDDTGQMFSSDSGESQ